MSGFVGPGIGGNAPQPKARRSSVTERGAHSAGVKAALPRRSRVGGQSARHTSARPHGVENVMEGGSRHARASIGGGRGGPGGGGRRRISGITGLTDFHRQSLQARAEQVRRPSLANDYGRRTRGSSVGIEDALESRAYVPTKGRRPSGIPVLPASFSGNVSSDSSSADLRAVGFIHRLSRISEGSEPSDNSRPSEVGRRPGGGGRLSWPRRLSGPSHPPEAGRHLDAGRPSGGAYPAEHRRSSEAGHPPEADRYYEADHNPQTGRHSGAGHHHEAGRHSGAGHPHGASHPTETGRHSGGGRHAGGEEEERRHRSGRPSATGRPVYANRNS